MKKTSFQNIWILSLKEMNTLFHSYTVYSGYMLLLCICAYVCWFSNVNFINMGQSSANQLFNTLNASLLLILPALTMQSVADERRQGTLELLLTKPLTIFEFVMGKYIPQIIFMVFIILMTLPYIFTLAYLGDIDFEVMILSYVGVILMGMCYLSIGIFASSVTKTPVTAFFIACLICACFYFIFQTINDMLYVDTVVSKICLYLSFEHHLSFFIRGIFNTSSIIYLSTIIISFLYFSKVAIERYKIHE